MNLSLPLSLSARLSMALDGLYRAVAARSSLSVLAGRGTEVLAVWLIRLVCFRVRRIETRILRMLARFQACKLVVAGNRAKAFRGGGAVKGVQRAEAKLPRRFAWLLPLVPCEAVNYASQLRIFLAEPEMVALLMASAQARFVLAPLCRMLGIEAAVLTPTPVAEVALHATDAGSIAVSDWGDPGESRPPASAPVALPGPPWWSG